MMTYIQRVVNLLTALIEYGLQAQDFNIGQRHVAALTINGKQSGYYGIKVQYGY